MMAMARRQKNRSIIKCLIGSATRSLPGETQGTQFCPCLVKLGACINGARITNQHDDNVQRRQILASQTERFANDAFDPVPLNGELHLAFRYHNAQPSVGTQCGSHDDPEGPGSYAFAATAQDAVEICLLGKPVPPFETLQSHRQTLSALSSTRVQDLAPTAGCHARSKAVGALSLDDAGLKCPLHILQA
jgi:hypothetical protein